LQKHSCFPIHRSSIAGGRPHSVIASQLMECGLGTTKPNVHESLAVNRHSLARRKWPSVHGYWTRTLDLTIGRHYLCATLAIEKWPSTREAVKLYIPRPAIHAPSNSRTTRLSVTYATKPHLTSSSRRIPHQAAEGQTLVAEGSQLGCRRVPLEGLKARRKYKRVHHRLTPNAICGLELEKTVISHQSSVISQARNKKQETRNGMGKPALPVSKTQSTVNYQLLTAQPICYISWCQEWPCALGLQDHCLGYYQSCGSTRREAM